MKGGPLCLPEREVTPVKCIILESMSEMCKWSIQMNTDFDYMYMRSEISVFSLKANKINLISIYNFFYMRNIYLYFMAT